MGSPDVHWVNSITCYNLGGNESTWTFLRLCEISLSKKRSLKLQVEAESTFENVGN